MSVIDPAHEVVENAWNLIGSVMRYLPDVDVLDTPEVLRVKTSVPLSLFNGVWRTKMSSAQAQRFIPEAKKFYADAGMPMEWWVYPSAEPKDLAAMLEDHGICFESSPPGMFAELTPIPPREEVRIDLVTTDRHTTDYRTVLAVFPLGEMVNELMANAIGRVSRQGKRMASFVGYDEDKPVACGTVLFGEKSAGLYNIATVDAARGKGFGTAITRTMMREAHNRGYRAAVLTSSRMGYPIYEKLGFREVMQLKHYMPKS